MSIVKKSKEKASQNDRSLIVVGQDSDPFKEYVISPKYYLPATGNKGPPLPLLNIRQDLLFST